MRFTCTVAASAIAFGALLSGFTTPSDASQTVQQHVAAGSLPAYGVLPQPQDDHGNG